MSRRGERIGRAMNSPLVMTGLVFAGANNPKTPGRGIVTGESLIDLDLSGLELAVLSACETGLGDVAGGEGTFGLQRAFHLAGTRDVVASLWKVPDQSTAALMALFYRNLWEKNLTPMESLRQAQLTIYRDPSKIPELAKGFRGKLRKSPAWVAIRRSSPRRTGRRTRCSGPRSRCRVRAVSVDASLYPATIRSRGTVLVSRPRCLRVVVHHPARVPHTPGVTSSTELPAGSRK